MIREGERVEIDCGDRVVGTDDVGPMRCGIDREARTAHVVRVAALPKADR